MAGGRRFSTGDWFTSFPQLERSCGQPLLIPITHHNCPSITTTPNHRTSQLPSFNPGAFQKSSRSHIIAGESLPLVPCTSRQLRVPSVLGPASNTVRVSLRRLLWAGVHGIYNVNENALHRTLRQRKSWSNPSRSRLPQISSSDCHLTHRTAIARNSTTTTAHIYRSAPAIRRITCDFLGATVDDGLCSSFQKTQTSYTLGAKPISQHTNSTNFCSLS